MKCGNLSEEQRKSILKQYKKFENVERVHSASVETFNTLPCVNIAIYYIGEKFNASDSVANLSKLGHPRISMTAEIERDRRLLKVSKSLRGNDG